MEINGKRMVKAAGAFCAAAGVAAMSGLVASGAAVGAVAEGFKAAKETMAKIMSGESEKQERSKGMHLKATKATADIQTAGTGAEPDTEEREG